MMCCRGQLSPQHGDRAFTFIAPSGLLAKGLAHMLHSLVRVSRRVGRGRLNTSSTGTPVALTATRSPPRFALHAVHTARFTRSEAPPFGVCRGGQGLPDFLGRAGAPDTGL